MSSPCICSPIAPQYLPVLIMLKFALKFLILFSGWRCRPVFLYLDCWICTVELLPLLRGFKLELSFKNRLSFYRYLFSEWTFKNIYHWRSIRLILQPQPTKRSTSSEESRETSLSTYHLTKAKRSKLPLSLESTFLSWPARSSLLKPSPIFQSSKKNWRWKDISLPIVYFVKYSRGSFGKIWIRKFIYIIFHIFYQSIFSCLIPRRWVNISSHWATNMLYLDSGSFLNREPTSFWW